MEEEENAVLAHNLSTQEKIWKVTVRTEIRLGHESQKNE